MFDLDGQKSDLVIKKCEVIGAKSIVFGHGSHAYVEKQKFLNHDIEAVFQKFTHPTYSQIHGKFIPEMSIIDLLFNEGRDGTKEILQNSVLSSS